MKNRNYHSDVAFLDLFLNALLGFVFLFIISWLLINPIAKNKTVDAKGEFIVTVSWDDEVDDDVDVWVLEPSQRVVWFGSKETETTHLDRDDLGAKNDFFYDGDGNRKNIKLNREVVTIRGIRPGEYVINVMLYRKSSNNPINVKVELIKVNPFDIVSIQEIVLTYPRQEETVFRFTVKPDGSVEDLNRLPKSIAGGISNMSNGGETP